MEVVVPEEFKYLYVRNSERPIYKVPAPVLRQKAHPVGRVTKRIQDLIDEMIRAMKGANGVGLAAPQMGQLQRIIVVASQGRPIPLINPQVVEQEGEQIGQEGCLSIPGLYGDVKRAQRVAVEGLDRRGRPIAYEMEGLAARVLLHEIDHLDGILFIDKVDMSTLHWSHPEKESVKAE
jgi:peptide deformylase